MTSRADQNDGWASYAGPGGWNGKETYMFSFGTIVAYLHSFRNIKIDNIEGPNPVIQILTCWKLEMEE